MLIGGVGIGFFIWDAWNSSSARSSWRCLVGIIGFLLDRMIASVSKFVTRGAASEGRSSRILSETRPHRQDLHPRQRHHKVLKDINLTIEKGDYVSIIGHSGGKSTLLNIVAGLTNATQGGVLENREVVARSRPRGVQNQPAALAHRLRERQARRRQGVCVQQDQGRARRLGDA
jgi:ABC-type glutathione transport system ATPase component